MHQDLRGWSSGVLDCPYLSPLAGHPAWWGAAPQVAPHTGRGFGAFVALGGGQRCTVVTTLAEDDAVAETWPTAWGALQGEDRVYCTEEGEAALVLLWVLPPYRITDGLG